MRRQGGEERGDDRPAHPPGGAGTRGRTGPRRVPRNHFRSPPPLASSPIPIGPRAPLSRPRHEREREREPVGTRHHWPLPPFTPHPSAGPSAARPPARLLPLWAACVCARAECFRGVKTGGEGRAWGQRSGKNSGPRAGTPPEAPLRPCIPPPLPPRRAALPLFTLLRKHSALAALRNPELSGWDRVERGGEAEGRGGRVGEKNT